MRRQLAPLAPLLLLVLSAPASGDDGKSKRSGKGQPDRSPPTVTAEERAGEQADALRDYLARDLVFISSPGIEAYLGDIAGALLATREDPPAVPRFLVQSTDEFTVFTDARGNIVVGSAVLREVESEDELAAALSHELAHVLSRDAETRSFVKRIPYTVETLGVVAGAVDGRINKAELKAGQLSSFARDALSTTQSVGTVWSDLVSPSWNRQQERDADLAGVEMVRAGGYDVAAFSTLFTRIDAAHAIRSDRVERLRQEALKKAQEKAPTARPATRKASVRDTTRDALKQAGSDAQANVVEALFNSLANWGTEYDPPEARTAAVLEYVQQTSTGRRDKTRRSPRFATELREGAGGQLLEADRAALAVMRAANSSTPAAASAEAQLLFAAAPGGNPVSPHLNLAMGTWLEAERRPAEAEQRAVAWAATDLAPRTAFLWRASYQVARGEYPAAMDTLERGADRMDDRSLFLPQMVATARAAGDVPRAEQLTTECARSRVRLDLGTLNRLLGQEAPAKPGGVYGECIAALGYDPIEKQRQEQAARQKATGQDPSRAQQKADDLNKKLAEALRKLGN